MNCVVPRLLNRYNTSSDRVNTMNRPPRIQRRSTPPDQVQTSCKSGFKRRAQLSPCSTSHLTKSPRRIVKGKLLHRKPPHRGVICTLDKDIPGRIHTGI